MRDSQPLEKLALAAKGKGFSCEAQIWRGYHVNYVFVCSHGHRFERRAAHMVYRDTPCPGCVEAAAIKRILDSVAARGGHCVVKEYRGTKAHQTVTCNKGHIWRPTVTDILQDHWCPTCRDDAMRSDIEQMREIARTRGGLCLSDTYVNSHSKLTWQCHLGHVWEAQAGAVKSRTWCPQCKYLGVTKNPARRKKYEMA